MLVALAVVGGAAIAQTLTGNDNNNRLVGSNHRDQISGQSGNDLIKGLGRADALSGGPGDDTIYAGPPTRAPWMPSTRGEGTTSSG